MNIKSMLRELKEVIPAENFKIQPAAAREEILRLEKKYNVNTSDFIKNGVLIADTREDISEKWLNELETFITFNGNMGDLNHLPSVESPFDSK